jgi:hypothetical protein
MISQSRIRSQRGRPKVPLFGPAGNPVVPRNMLVGNILQELNNPGEHSLMFIERIERV